jgi:hypothetical protein
MSQTSAPWVRRPLLSLLICALAVGLAVVASPGRAQSQSQASETRAVTLAAPGVSFVGTDLRVCVRFRYTNVTECYRQGVTGSAFAVTPDGYFVTASHVAVPDSTERRALKHYAANQFFAKYDLLSAPDGRSLLEACYAGDACAFTLRSTLHVYPAVQVAGVSVPKPLAATVIRYTGFEDSDVAILKVDATNMPTVQLDASIADLAPGDTIVALGYPGSTRDLPTGMTEPTKTFGRVSNIRTGAVGSSKQIEVDLQLKRGLSGGPVVRTNGKVVGLTSYSLVGDDGTSEQGFIRTVEDIRAALKAAGVEAARGEGDTVFEQAMQHFWNQHYSAALPLFDKVLNLYDGHPLAKEYLAKAQAKANGPDDVPLASEGPVATRRDLVRVGLPIGAVLLVLGGVLVVVLRRRRPASPARTSAPPVPAPGSGSAPSPFGWSVDDDIAPTSAFGQPTPGRDADAVSGAEQSASVVTALDAPELEAFERVTSAHHRFCSQCGNEVIPGSRFCSACGQPLR